MKLSKEAESALLAAQNRTGAELTTTGQIHAELKRAGLVSPSGYLTARGQRKRSSIAHRMEDEAFG